MFHPRWAPLLMAFFMSAFMVLLVTGTLGVLDGHFTVAGWLRNFMHVWPVAFVVTMIVLPLVRRLVGWLTRPPAAGAGKSRA